MLFSKKRPALLLFDVNETLLDMFAMEEEVNKTFKNELAFKFWFAQLLEYSLVENSTATYHSFSEVGKAVMKMTVEASGKEISEAKQKELVEMVNTTQPHPDVVPALRRLKQAGFRMATLSNSPAKATVPHLEMVGLKEFFEATMSVDSVKKFKPHASTYQYAADQLGVKLEETMLVAAHGWDIAGAIRSGARAAFIKRSGKSLYPLAQEPELKVYSFNELADRLIDMNE